MSRGFGAHADLVAQDNETVIYQYGGYNLNEPEFRNEKHLYDGVITISRSCFAKLITKRIPVRVDYPQMISDGRIIIENCSNCWHRTPDGIDVMACHILFHLFLQYQEDGKMPDYISYNV